MWYLKTSMRAWPVFVVLTVVALAHHARAAVLDVCPTCTSPDAYATLDDAIADAEAGDTIIIDGPDNVGDAPVSYTLSTNLVIDDTLDGLEIRGESDSDGRPHQIQIMGTGTGPVITVEEQMSFTIRGVTIMNGTTGILAMLDSNVDIRRCLFDGIAGVAVDCVEPEEVYIAASVFTNGTDDAVRIDDGGELNITQCTFLSNTGVAVNAQQGIADVVASLVHDCGVGMIDGTGTALTPDSNWVTDASGAVIAVPNEVDPYPNMLDPVTTFETTDNFPGELDDLFTPVPRTGKSADDFDSLVEFFARDFGNLGRDPDDLVIGADEQAEAATAALWSECYIIQNGVVRNWINEGPVSVILVTPRISLINATLWIGHPPSATILDANNRIGDGATQILIDVPSEVDSNYGTATFTADLELFDAAFDALAGDAVNTGGYELFIVTAGGSPPAGTPNAPLPGELLDEDSADGAQAEVGRVFGFDTIPPTVRMIGDLADQYLSPDPATDGGAVAGGRPTFWDPDDRREANIGANFGTLDGAAAEPQVFFNDPETATPTVNIRVEFEDEGSGFAPSDTPAATSAPGTKRALLYNDYREVPGYPFWTENRDSNERLVDPPAVGLQVTYNRPSLNEMIATWSFSNLFYTSNQQWHAIANIRITDLAGNEAVLRPYHLWWFPFAEAQFRTGPGGAETSNPVFSWGLNRFSGGQDPEDPEPVGPSVQWRVWARNNGFAPAGTEWVDVTGSPTSAFGWSGWMLPSPRTITLDTYFDSDTTLRDLLANAAPTFPPPNDYLIAIRGYDEAGNAQDSSPLGGGQQDLPVGPPGSPPQFGTPLAFHIWTDPGVSASLGLDTAVQSSFWYNELISPDPAPNRVVDAGEQVVGAVSRIPLPNYCARVEGGFKIDMQLPDNIPLSAALVGFELYEDGRYVAGGLIPGSNAINLVLPFDLLDPTVAGITPLDPPFTPFRPPRPPATGEYLEFLNFAPAGPPPALDCGGVQDRLGDDGNVGVESPNRKRNVKYQLVLATGIPAGGDFAFDATPAVVEFTVTVDRQLNDEQPIKSFTQE